MFRSNESYTQNHVSKVLNPVQGWSYFKEGWNNKLQNPGVQIFPPPEQYLLPVLPLSLQLETIGVSFQSYQLNAGKLNPAR